jgi:hypothetical protein
MSTQDDITKLLDIQELIVIDIEIKEKEVILNRYEQYIYHLCRVSEQEKLGML